MPVHLEELSGLADKRTGARLPLTGVSVHAVVDDTLATHTIIQRFENPNDAPLEVVFTFPVESGASVSGMEVRPRTVCRARLPPRARPGAACDPAGATKDRAER